MAQLTKGMYGSQSNPTGGLFGLYCGQMRGGKTKLTHNSGWYNKLGEKLGWGDLTAKDFRRIAKGLKDGELFITLGEQDSFWNFVTRYGAIGSMCAVKPEAEAPGAEYVAAHASYVIARNQLYQVDRFGDLKEKISEWHGLRFKLINPADLKALMTTSTAA
ncbi:hypothetical protein HYT45_03845 [Candidatus Uhrbacteria bacterium]|nr:hypothetical protein [Candidatus Wildermuthbacteria bacterium]MBI2099509.1 hypothetical protein [Candidatus Uhrbacteria bacterium]